MTELVFKEDTHQYFADGVLVPSVTQILSDVGLWPDYERLDSWYADRGSKVHKAVALSDKMRLNWNELDNRIMGFVESYQKWRKLTGYKPFQSETPVYNEMLNYAGTPDSYGSFPNESMHRLIDVKCGQPCIFFGLQLAGYSLCLRDHYSFKRTTVHLKEDGSCATHRVHDNVDDFNQFKAAVTVYHSKRRIK